MPFIKEESEGGGGSSAPGLVAQLVTNVMTEGSFDVTEAQALQWLSRRHQLMCTRTRCYRKRLTVGTTIAGQLDYLLPPEVSEIREVLVNGIPYGEGRHSDLAQGKLGYIWLDGLYAYAGGGLYLHDYDANGETTIALYPTPTEGGQQIVVYAVCRPPDLQPGEDFGIKIPHEFLDALVAGAIATGLTRTEARADLAGPFEQTFSAGCAELLSQVNRRFRGSGAAQIRLSGVNA